MNFFFRWRHYKRNDVAVQEEHHWPAHNDGNDQKRLLFEQQAEIEIVSDKI